MAFVETPRERTLRLGRCECKLCELSYSDAAAEAIRHEAICRRLGVLTPAEVKQIRERRGFNRAEFATFTKIETAPLVSWESGAQIQNPAMDQYLRLLSHDSVIGLLSIDKMSTARGGR